MANASYSIRPSINGNQHSQFPTGNYVPPPTVLNALVSPAGVSLSFTDNSFGLARNVIRRSTSAGGPFYDVINLPAGVTSYLNVEVPPGTYYYQVVALAGNGSSTPSNTVSLTVPGSATGAQYRFTPPPIGTREFQIVNIPTAGLDSGTGAGQRYVITFATNSGYLLLAPPDSAITGMVDIETNAQTVVLHGAEFLPDFAVEKVTGPAGNLTVGKVLDIFTTGSNSPEIYLYKNKFRTTDDNGTVVWNVGDPVNVGGTQSADNTKWPLTYMEQNWIDDLYGFAVDTVGHTDCIKSNSGPVRGFRIARNRWACSYQFFILFTGHNETWGAYPGGTNEMFDNQWYSINPPPSWSEPVANNLYLSTSYTNQVSNGFYHAYLFNGTGAGGTDGYGTYINMSGNTQDANLGGIMSPPVGYGFQLSGSDLVAISGQPPANRNNDMDWVQGTIYNGTHPKLNDISTRDRPVMRSETGSAYRITTREQLEAIVATATPNAPTSFAASVSGTTINLSWTDTNSGAAQTVIERSTDAGATWSALITVAAGTNSYVNAGLSAGSYYYRARALIGSVYSGYTSTASGTVGSASWQLAAGHFEPSRQALEIIAPQAGLSTTNRYYKAYPGLLYRVPVSVLGGAWPYKYELTTAPSGMTIGSIYGDADYGIINWSSPAISGSPHTVTVKVTDQEGTFVTVTYTLTVTTSGFIFVDAVNGNASAFNGGTGTGTLANPFLSMADWYNGDGSVTGSSSVAYKLNNTYTGYFVYYRTGTYHVDAATREDVGVAPRMACINNMKPQVHLAYPGESPVISVQNSHINYYGTNQTLWFSGIYFQDIGASSTYKTIVFDSTPNFMSFENRFQWATDNPTTGANSSYHFCGRTSDSANFPNKRISIIGCTIEGESGYNYLLAYDAEKIVIENNTVSNSSLTNGFYFKENNRSADVRRNVGMTNNGAYLVRIDGISVCQDIDVRHNLYKSTNQGLHLGDDATHSVGAVYDRRNTWIVPYNAANGTSMTGSWETTRNVILHDGTYSTFGGGIGRTGAGNALTITNTNNLTATSGLVDSSTGLLTGADRTNYLGVRGHEVA